MSGNGVTRAVNDRAIARWRLHTQGLAGAGLGTPTDVVTTMLGVQAENLVQHRWAIGTRSRQPVTDEVVRQLIDDGELLRTHVLRPTWHTVRPDDIRWLLDLTGPRIRKLFTQSQRAVGLDDATLDRAAEPILDALRGQPRTREELRDWLTAEGLPAGGAGLRLMLTNAELIGAICSGPLREGQHTWALLEERAPGARLLDREDALAELALRYVTGHGPVTDRDLAYWSSLTLTDVRFGLTAVQDQLESFVHDGRTFWHATDPPPDGPPDPVGHLLLTLDEYHNGVQDSRGVLDVDGVVPSGRLPNIGMALLDGQMVGGFTRTATETTVVFDLRPYRELTQSEVAALHVAADAAGRFLGLQAELRRP